VLNKNGQAIIIPSPQNKDYDPSKFRRPPKMSSHQLPAVSSSESLSPYKKLNANSPNSRATLNLMDGKDPYIPVTVLNIKNQTDFSKISNLISNTYDFQSATREDNQT
jgi:hypothetical protein